MRRKVGKEEEGWLIELRDIGKKRITGTGEIIQRSDCNGVTGICRRIGAKMEGIF